MPIEHIAIWTRNLEQLKAFYETYFQAVAGAKYLNPGRQFESYFLTFASGARLELMQLPSVSASPDGAQAPRSGYAHLAFSVGAQAQVDALTARLKTDGYQVITEPRRTGDGYYEGCVLDPDGNLVEIIV